MTSTRATAGRPHRCTGHGQCGELLPELVTLDEWGYFVLRDAAVPPDLRAQARRAVSTCPRLALHTYPIRT